MADVLSMSGICLILSERLKEKLASLNVESIQLIPVEIEHANGDLAEEKYYLLHIFSQQKVLNRDEYGDEMDEYDTVSDFENITFDDDLIEAIPENMNKIFIVHEYSQLIAVHKDIYDEIMSINPTGMYSCSVDEWEG